MWLKSEKQEYSYMAVWAVGAVVATLVMCWAGMRLAEAAAAATVRPQMGRGEAVMLMAEKQAEAEAERLEKLKVYEQEDFDFMHGVVYEPVDGEDGK